MTLIVTLFPEGDVNQSFLPEYETLIRKALEGKSIPNPTPFVDAQKDELPGEQLLITQNAEFRVGSGESWQTHFLHAGQVVYFPRDPNRTVH